MCQAVHASATTMETVRRAIQHSQKSLRLIFNSDGPYTGRKSLILLDRAEVFSKM